MASLQDVADQINVKLDQIINNTAATTTAVHAVDATLHSGFADLAAGLFAQLEIQRASLAELAHHSAQNSTIICLLENNNELLCDMTRKMTTQIEIADATNRAVERIEGITERVHCDAAADFDRELKIKAALLECCPPEPRSLEACPDGCPVSQHEPHKPSGQDWQPTPREG